MPRVCRSPSGCGALDTRSSRGAARTHPNPCPHAHTTPHAGVTPDPTPPHPTHAPGAPPGGPSLLWQSSPARRARWPAPSGSSCPSCSSSSSGGRPEGVRSAHPAAGNKQACGQQCNAIPSAKAAAAAALTRSGRRGWRRQRGCPHSCNRCPSPCASSGAAPPCWPARQAENGAGGVRAVRGRRQLVAGGGGRRRRHVCHGRPRQPPAAPPAVSRTSFSALRRLYSSSSELLELVVEGLRCRLFFSFFSFFSFLCFPITPEFRAGRPRCARLTPEATRFSHCCTGCTAQLE